MTVPGRPDSLPPPLSLESLLLLWQEERARGRELSARELCPDQPTLAAELQRAIDALPQTPPLSATTPSDVPDTRTTEPGDGAATGGQLPPGGLPDYEILEELGQGGMGVVYRARQLSLPRVVAVKMIRPDGHISRADLTRFRTEAEAIARLTHANIVQIFEVGEHAGLPFFSLEFCGGGSLEKRLRTSPLPPGEAATLVRTLATAIQVVHERGIVHRDLKPGNVLLAADGTPKITDFGLAKKLDEQGPSATRTGSIMGTPSYMAPEQAQGKQAGPLADVYALGAILYECLTGRPPFLGANTWDVLAQVIGDDPVAPTRLQRRCPRDLETICLKCLEKSPAARYPSARDLADDLQHFAEGRPIRARPVSWLERAWRWCRRQPVQAALALACLLLVTALAGAGVAHAYRLNVLWRQVHAAEMEAVTAREVAATHEYHLLTQSVRQRADRLQLGWPRTGLADLRQAATLPTRVRDLDQLRSEAARCLAAEDLTGPRKVALGFLPARLAYHPTRPLLAVAQDKSWLECVIVLLDVETGKIVRRLSFVPLPLWKTGPAVQGGIRALAISPDGRWLVAGERGGGLRRWDLNAADSGPKALAAHKDEVRDLLFSPAGDALYSSSADGSVLRWSIGPEWKQTHRLATSGRLALAPGNTGLLIADPERTQLVRLADLQPARPAWPLPASRIVSAGQGLLAVASRGNVSLVDGQSGQVTRTLYSPGQGEAHQGEVSALHFSPDGLLLVSASTSTRNARLWDVASGRLLYNLPLEEGASQPAFSPDGRTLALLSGREAHLYRIDRPGVYRLAGLHAWPVHAAALLGQGDGLACLAGDRVSGTGTASLWSLDGDCQQRWQVNVRLPAGHLEARVEAEPTGPWLAWTTQTGVQLADRSGPTASKHASADGLHALSFAPNGQLWLAAGKDLRRVGLPGLAVRGSWSNDLGDVVTGRGDLWAVAVGRRWALAAGRDGILRLLDARSVTLLQSWKLCPGGLRAVALAGDEQSALVGTCRGEVIRIALPTGDVLARQNAHTDCVEAIVFAGPDCVASGSADGRIRLWHLRDGNLIPWLSIDQPGPVAALSADTHSEALAVVRTGERAVGIWSLARLRAQLRELGLSE